MNVPSRIFDLGVGGAAALRASHPTEADLFFDFLIGLPEKKIRRDRGPKDRHHHRQKTRVETESGNECRLEHLAPIGPGKHRRADISEERQRQPLERSGNQTIRAPDLQREDRQRHG